MPQTNRGLEFNEYHGLPIGKKETRLNINSYYQPLGDYRVEKVQETFETELLRGKAKVMGREKPMSYREWWLKLSKAAI